jgi:hypothetical protein
MKLWSLVVFLVFIVILQAEVKTNEVFAHITLLPVAEVS